MNSNPSSSTQHQNQPAEFVLRRPQALILRLLDNFRFVTAVCHRRLGKTILAVYWLIRETLTLSDPNTRSYYFAASQKQAKLISWHYFKHLIPLLLHPQSSSTQKPIPINKLIKYSETELQIIFPQGQRIIVAGSENVEFYRGVAIDRIVMDEIASWRNPYYAYFEVLRPAMADRQAHGLFIGTPKTLDLFFDFYQQGLSEEPLFSDYASIKLPASLTNIIPPKELQQLQRTMSPDAYARELECDFFAESPDILITPKEATQALDTNRTLTPAQRAYSLQLPPIFGVDPGRHADPTVVMSRQGLILHPPLLHTHNPDSMVNAQRISTLINLHKPQFIFVDAAKGGGLIDRLRQLGHENVIEVHFNESSPEPGAVNMRAAMFVRFKRWLQKGVIVTHNDDASTQRFLKEITNILLVPDEPDNRIKIQPKSKIMEAIQTSPNMLDAAGLTFVADDTDQAISMDPEELKRQALERLMQTYGINQQEEYDPLNHLNAQPTEDFLI